MTDRITLQLIGSSLLFASEEMGLALRNSAYSPNIKERMDHSAAIFDAKARLLAQAEHIPVHLGSLPWGLRNLVAWCRRNGVPLEEGIMVASNDPYLTGTHLNDLTVLAPVYHRGELVAFAVNKAHHSDVGGSVPGSISPNARSLEEEGLVMAPEVVWRGGGFVRRAVDSFSNASRTPAERKGDLRAQVAANISGIRRTRSIIQKYGIETFRQASAHSFKHSAAMTRTRLSALVPGSYSASDIVEGPSGEELVIRAKVDVSPTGISIDYSGTSAQVDYPLNAVLGVTISGAHFVIRSITGSDIPANHGAFSSVRVSAPRGSFLNPTSPHPVGGGNVETSQRNADVLFRALVDAAPGLIPAAAGGSMNNVMMGGRRAGRGWAFYETIGVGLGARSDADGLDGIQANMTNTMNTPIEEMERAFPVRVVRYEFRVGSGGRGRTRGGCGLVRSFTALADGTSFTILADRERHGPWGLNGGRDGEATRILLRRAGDAVQIGTKTSLELNSGDQVDVMTAGGGGYGNPGDRSPDLLASDIADGLYPESPDRGLPSRSSRGRARR